MGMPCQSPSVTSTCLNKIRELSLDCNSTFIEKNPHNGLGCGLFSMWSSVLSTGDKKQMIPAYYVGVTCFFGSTGVPPLRHTAGSPGRVSKHGIMHLGR
jgi:hypothetical protein